jgi:hypothetical protein
LAIGPAYAHKTLLQPAEALKYVTTSIAKCPALVDEVHPARPGSCVEGALIDEGLAYFAAVGVAGCGGIERKGAVDIGYTGHAKGLERGI